MNRKQMHQGAFFCAVAAMLVACGVPTGATSPTAVATSALAATSAPKPTNAPVATSEPASTSAPQPTAAATITPIPIILTAVPTSAPAPTNAPAAPAPTAVPPIGGVDLPYLDDRSNAEALLDSFYNAINRKEYARAYAYWQPGAKEMPAYSAFEQGYSSTNAVKISYGTLNNDNGAGQVRFYVPVSITSETTGGTQYFVGCYTAHLASPAAQATLPFQPLAIESAVVQQSSAAPAAEALEKACQDIGVPVPRPANDPGTIDTSNYLDNRSDPVAVVRSFYNAINRHEYTRAYSYWQDQSELAPLPAFAEGYSATKSVALTIGEVQSDAGAGQRNYRVPVTIQSQMNDASAQTFAGCYTLHLSSPPIQSPPFKPLGITAATIQQVAAGQNPTDVMTKSCQ